MTEIIESAVIAGVKVARLRVFEDERGRFMELFRKDWFTERTWDIVQTNRSDSHAGVLRGLHYHRHQVDYWHVTQGSIRVALADLRRSSQTYGSVETIDLVQDDPCGLFIPVGVAHGFYALTDATLTYVVDNYYDGADELGVAWNDTRLGIDWCVEDPVLSQRDLENRSLAEIPEEDLPD